MSYKSETEKYRHLTKPHCYLEDGTPATVLDVASQGDPVVPWAWQIDLPPDRYAWYNSNEQPRGPIQLRGFGDKLPLDNSCLDVLYSSHLLEDFADWEPVLREWVRVIVPSGKLIVLIPEKDLWDAAIKAGQCPNCEHRHEGRVGELSTYAERLNLRVIEDRLTNIFPGDYSILFIAQKLA